MLVLPWRSNLAGASAFSRLAGAAGSVHVWRGLLAATPPGPRQHEAGLGTSWQVHAGPDLLSSSSGTRVCWARQAPALLTRPRGPSGSWGAHARPSPSPGSCNACLGWEEQPQHACRLLGRVAPAGDRLGGEQDGVALLQGVGGLAELQLEHPVEDE